VYERDRNREREQTSKLPYTCYLLYDARPFAKNKTYDNENRNVWFVLKIKILEISMGKISGDKRAQNFSQFHGKNILSPDNVPIRLVVLGDITVMMMSLLSMFRRFLPSH
jgi:hypothetical protein